MTGRASSWIPGSAALRCPASLSSEVMLIGTFTRGCCFAFPDVFWVICKQHSNMWIMWQIPLSGTWGPNPRKIRQYSMRMHKPFSLNTENNICFPLFQVYFTRYWSVNDYIAIDYYCAGEPLQHKKAFCQSQGKMTLHPKKHSTDTSQELWEGRFTNVILLTSFPLDLFAPEEMPLK